MAGLDAETKQRVRDIAVQWLEAENKWRRNFPLRVVLAVLVYPVYVIYGLVMTVFILIPTTLGILFAIFLCFVTCFRLDVPLRKCLHCICGAPEKPEENQEQDPEAGNGVPVIKDNEEDPDVSGEFNQNCAGRAMNRLLKAVLWGRLVLASPGRFIIRKQLNKIKEGTAQFLLERSSFTYLLSKETVLQLESWPKHEEAIAQNLLLRVPLNKMKPPQTGARVLNPVLFVSHKWIGNKCDTDENEVLAKVKERINTTPKSFVWFDYSCVPQENDQERMLHLRSIPDILSRCEVSAFLHNDIELANNYLQSIWCQLEFIMSGLDMKQLSGERSWTIYDPSDLYLILPSFIHMTCHQQNFYEMFGGVRKLGGHVLLAQILKYFVNWHDKTHNAGA